MPSPLETALESVRALRARPAVDDAFIAELRRLLLGRFAPVVGKAARLAIEREIGAERLEADLTAAFERFAVNGAEIDKGCHAKAAVAEALQTMRAACAPLYLRGVRLRQMEKVWAESVDTAVDVRAACAMGLVRMGHPAAMDELAELLADPEAPARRAAARAIAYSEDRRGGPLLRFKALSGDADPTVVAECLSGLLSLSPAANVDFAARFLESRDAALREMAALALGESRHASALEPLRTFFERNATGSDDLRATALAAIAMLRQEAAFDFLVETIAGESSGAAIDALRALLPYRGDPALARRAREAVAARGDTALDADLIARFAP